MTTLPVYKSNERLDTGGRQLRSITPDNQIGRATQQLGRSITSAAVQIGNEQERDRAKVEAQAKADENLALDVGLQDYVLDLEKEYNRKKEELGDNPTGLTTHMEGYTSDRAKELLQSKFKGHHNQKYVEAKLRRAQQSFLMRSTRDETTGRVRYRMAQADAKVGMLEAAIAQAPENIHAALVEAEDYVTNVVNAPANIKTKMGEHIRKRLQKAYVRSKVIQDPEARANFVQNFSKNFGGKSPKVQKFRNSGDKAVYDAASAAGVDPAALFAIGHIESRNQDNRGNPVINGRVASSAVGRFQVIRARSTLRGLGISEQDRFDINKTAPAMADYYRRQAASLKASGFRGDTAEVYMTWNIGPSPARALLRAAQSRPGASFASVIVPILKRSGHGPGFINQYLRNNPAFYNANTPVGTVVNRYRNKINNARKATNSLLEGSGGLSDKVARQALQGMGSQSDDTGFDPGVDTSLLTAKDVGEIYSELVPAMKKEAKDKVEMARGQAKANGEAETTLNDPDDQKDINRVSSEELRYGPKIIDGDSEASIKARQLVSNGKFIPKDIVNSLTGAIDSGGEGSARAYEFFADVYRNEKSFFKASKVRGDIASRIERFDALTQGGLTMTPGQAIKIIERAESERGKMQLDAVKKVVKEELEDVDAETIEQKFDASSFDFADPQGLNDSARNLLLKTYREHYTHRRAEGHTAQEADIFATEQLKKIYGVSTVATDERSQSLMPYPPEQHYRANADGSYEWIRQQAKNFVATTFMMGPGEPGEGPTEDEVNNIEVRIIPTGQTANDVASNRPPSYMVAFKRADGRIDVVPEPFTPNQATADTLDRIELDRRRAPRPIFKPGSPSDRLWGFLTGAEDNRRTSPDQAPFVEGPGLPE